MLEVIGISCSRNDSVLFTNLSFNLSPGTALQICAANGAGKTTLLKTILGILPLSVGKISVNSSILYLGHKTNLHPALSAKQNLKFLHCLNGKTELLEQDLNQALSLVDLWSEQDISCDQLSAGQCQRINLARLYLSAAKLWILDEPFINLDTTAKALGLELCANHLQAGGALLLAAHNQIGLANIDSITLEDYV